MSSESSHTHADQFNSCFPVVPESGTCSVASQNIPELFIPFLTPSTVFLGCPVSLTSFIIEPLVQAALSFPCTRLSHVIPFFPVTKFTSSKLYPLSPVARPAIKASAYGSRVGWTPTRRIHTYIHTSSNQTRQSNIADFAVGHTDVHKSNSTASTLHSHSERGALWWLRLTEMCHLCMPH